MCADALDRQIVRDFWARKSREERNRWTSEELLAYELAYLRELAPAPRSILDLGSGHGELSRPLAGDTARLLAVDFADGYWRSFDRPNHAFAQAGVGEFRTGETFDVVLLFGVVTYIGEAEEAELYGRIAGWLAAGGVAVIKNQCALGETFVATGYSESLGAEYSGRYPRTEEQHARLAAEFSSVQPRPYPERFNAWETSAHVAFVCGNG